METALAKNLPDSGFSIQRLEMVGPKVGADLRGKALEAFGFVLTHALLIGLLYVPLFTLAWSALRSTAG